MPSTKELKQRIKGIKNTGKITRAMEMISAVKMRKAVAKVTAIRPYAKASLEVLAQVSSAMKVTDATYFEERPIRKVLAVVLTSNRGLCGSFNASVLRQLKREEESLKSRHSEMERLDFVSVGRKGDQMLRRFDGDIKASFSEMASGLKSAQEVRPLARMIRDEYESGRYDRVMLIYTDYVSPMTQVAKTRRLLPLSQGALRDELKEMNHSKTIMYEEVVNGNLHRTNESALTRSESLYSIEPDPETVLKTLVPRLIEMQLYHALLESIASQEAARMTAMHNATDAAKDMVADFTLSYNQLRQAKVTQEIAELSAGMAAVNG